MGEESEYGKNAIRINMKFYYTKMVMFVEVIDRLLHLPANPKNQTLLCFRRWFHVPGSQMTVMKAPDS